MGSQVLFLLVVTLFQLLSDGGVLSFNLEPKLPVIKRGDPSSYFGFSVAQHSTSDGTPWYVTKTYFSSFNPSLLFLILVLRAVSDNSYSCLKVEYSSSLFTAEWASQIRRASRTKKGARKWVGRQVNRYWNIKAGKILIPWWSTAAAPIQKHFIWDRPIFSFILKTAGKYSPLRFSLNREFYELFFSL